MPKGKSHKTPAYRLHKCSGQAYVTLNGSRHYLGRHDTPQAAQRYHTLIAEWLANDGRLPIQPEHITVVELIDRYFEFAKRYYRKADGTPTLEIANLRLALRPVNRLYGEVRVSDFGPRGLKTVRNVLIERGGGIVVCTDTEAFTWNVNGEKFGAHWDELTGVRRTGAREAEAIITTVTPNPLPLTEPLELGALVPGSRIEPINDNVVNIAVFDDGSPAITRHAYGKGHVYFFAADPFYAVGDGKTRKSTVAQGRRSSL